MIIHRHESGAKLLHRRRNVVSLGELEKYVADERGNANEISKDVAAHRIHPDELKLEITTEIRRNRRKSIVAACSRRIRTPLPQNRFNARVRPYNKDFCIDTGAPAKYDGRMGA